MSAARRPSPAKKNAPVDAPTSRRPVSSKGPSTTQNVRQNTEPVNVLVGEIVRSNDGAQVIPARAAEMDWTLTRLTSEDEPRIRDVDLAERLGFERPRSIRQIIERHVSAGNITPSCRHTVERQPVGPKGKSKGEREYTVTEFWLTLEEALFITTQSETKRAVFVTKVMIAVFAAVMRGARASNDIPPGVLSVLEGLRCDLAEARKEHQQLVQLVARSSSHRADSLRKKINAAASLTSQATRRSFKSCRMEIESIVRDRAGYPRSPRNTFEAMPAHVWEQATLFAEQELYRAERLNNAIAQATLKAVVA